MEPNATILRVKRKRGTDPADTLLLACKRIRPETIQAPGETPPEPGEADVEKSVFKLVATVATQDAPVETEVRRALSRPRVAHALRPSANSTKRILADSRNAKLSVRREERYRILSSHRADLSLAPRRGGDAPEAVAPPPAEEGETPEDGVQVVDLLHEDLPEQDKPLSKTPPSSDLDAILCNNTKMLRERLRLNDTPLEDGGAGDDYVYDLYYQETLTPGWIQDILSVRAYADHAQLVSEEGEGGDEEMYDDEDDENEESNWRNDYPDGESEDDSDGEGEERYYGREWADVEEGAPIRRNWQQYQREILQELGRVSDDHDTDQYDSD
ncbi:putative RNA polymerase II nuclear localization protein SLC7A6OS [Stigmatopora argus]